MSTGTSFVDLAAAKTRLLFISIGLLLLRIGIGGSLIVQHGWPKLAGFGGYESFPDPLGLGVKPTLALAIFAELFCAAAVVLGLGTRLAAGVLIVNMGVIVFVVHGADEFAKKELGLLYLIPFITLALAGGGGFSLDSILWRRRRNS